MLWLCEIERRRWLSLPRSHGAKEPSWLRATTENWPHDALSLPVSRLSPPWLRRLWRWRRIISRVPPNCTAKQQIRRPPVLVAIRRQHGSEEQMFDADEQVPYGGQSD